jgi:hypothetical protein
MRGMGDGRLRYLVENVEAIVQPQVSPVSAVSKGIHVSKYSFEIKPGHHVKEIYCERG